MSEENKPDEQDDPAERRGDHDRRRNTDRRGPLRWDPNKAERRKGGDRRNKDGQKQEED